MNKPTLLFVADGRSPIALNWIRYFTENGYTVHLVSTYPCQPDLSLASLQVIAPAFGEIAGEPFPVAAGGRSSTPVQVRRLLRRVIPMGARSAIRQWLGPLTLPGPARRLSALLKRIQPNLVHAMRVPYEGMLAALADPPMPLLISIWGNDFTLHARSTPAMAALTRRTMQRASALHADCFRDQRLAQRWGFRPSKPSIVLPGSGGIQMDVFFPSSERPNPHSQPTVINPRGFRAYVRTDTFFKAIPLVLQARPEVRFLCPATEHEPQARRWVEQLGIASAVDLLPRVPRQQMAELFRQSQIVVSPTTHDGTPNTLLEGMACGCFPIAGDIESLREWITPGVNGLLVHPDDAKGLAEAVLSALAQPALLEKAKEHNLRLIGERAEYRQVMEQAEDFYRKLAG